MLPRKKKKRNYTIGQKLLAAKRLKEVDDTIKGNPYREAVKDEMYKMSQDEREDDICICEKKWHIVMKSAG